MAGLVSLRVGGALGLLVVVACAERREKQRSPVPLASGREDASPPDDAASATPTEPRPPPAVGAGPSRRLSTTFVARDVNHVLGTGQSLSVGAVGYPALSRTQPYGNLMFSTGVLAGGEKLTAFVPLVEGAVRGGAHPDDETMSSGFANLVSKLAEDLLPRGQRHDLLVSVHGVGGVPYAGLRRGTPPFSAGVAQLRAAAEIARARGLSYVVRAVTNVHGESDHQAANPHYAADLAEWQADYEAAVRPLTKQAESIPMLHSQVSSWTKYGSATSAIPGAQLAATVASKGKLVLVGPKYHLAYSADGIHLTNEGYRHMGEDYAKVYERVVLEGRAWEPLRPVSVTRTGAVIRVRFLVPSPPIVLDDVLVANPGNHGFELTQTGAPAPAITSVAVTGPDTITITLASVPTGDAKRLRYAFSGTVGAAAGPRTGARGNVRDSDATVSRHGHALYNWCVHFEEPVP